MVFQSSFELTGYITTMAGRFINVNIVSKLFRAYGLYNGMLNFTRIFRQGSFKALSSLRVI